MDVRGRVRVGDGSEAAPSLTFRLDTDTGIWRPGANRLIIATAGADRWEVDANGHLIPSDNDTYDIGDATHQVRSLNLAFDSFTPALTAATTNPTLGTGSSVEGYYARIGELVIGYARIQFGTSGTNPGSGNYRVSLPVAADSALYNNAATPQVGWASALSAGNGRQGIMRVQVVGGTTCNIQDPGAQGSTTVAYTQWSDTHPDNWTSSDRIFYSFFYKAD